MRKIILAIGGSSGSVYAKRILEKMSQVKSIELGVVMTDNAVINWEIEIGKFEPNVYSCKFYEKHDFNAPFASGSAKYDTMIVCPCSMGLMARIASGTSNDLITRAADVILKERRKLIIVPRETPYNLIHINNMRDLTLAGGIIAPACPSFYSKPQNVEELVDTVVDRILDLAEIEIDTFRWGSNVS